MKECFVDRNFSADSLRVIQQADTICRGYARQGYDLTLRQLYYQFVSRGLIPNKDTEYKRLGSIVNDARLAGMIDWDHITDRTRNLAQALHFDNPADRIEHASRAYKIDLWEGQEDRVEVWVEKEALAGVVERAARPWDTPHFSCRGYVSQSEMWAAGKRLAGYIEQGQRPIIIHLGDHDPSGIDMTRDVTERLWMFACDSHDFANLQQGASELFGKGADLFELDEYYLEDLWGHWCEGDKPDIEVNRIALNMDQVRRYNPPPNPAKFTDSRCEGYVKQFGSQSWELDALDPATLNALISNSIRSYMDEEVFETRRKQQEKERELLTSCSDRWSEVVALLEAA